jgi:predicted nucleic acid-binding protein
MEEERRTWRRARTKYMIGRVRLTRKVNVNTRRVLLRDRRDENTIAVKVLEVKAECILTVDIISKISVLLLLLFSMGLTPWDRKRTSD